MNKRRRRGRYTGAQHNQQAIMLRAIAARLAATRRTKRRRSR